MTPARLGNFALAAAVARIEAFAKTYRKVGRARRYVLVEGTLVREERILAEPGRFMKALGNGPLLKVELPLSAQAIVANWNLRIIGLGDDGRLTAQVRMRGTKGSLFREVRARRAVARLLAGDAEVAVPALRAYDRTAGLWLVEDFVNGRPGELSDLAAYLAGPAAGFYRRTARPRPIARVFARARPLLAELAASEPRLRRLAALPDDTLWPVALCHGDVMVGNILRTADRRFWLADWERAAVQPIALDLAATVMWQPPMRDAALAILRQLDPGGISPTAEDYLVLGMVLLLQRRRDRAGGRPRPDDWREGHLLGLMRSLLG